ncbi:unnamed protein product [Phaedon cochleariae]|uniref:Actin-related protein 6 n=1 Tax=Phaedon cochleariae TaxID=80249 RepID=A0A9P0GTV2_PHACE|nr:unnamed protein product [Phaedon cochleariae]
MFKSKRRRTSGAMDSKPAKKESIEAIIVDSGAYSIKAGLSSIKKPNVIPNCIMKAKSERKRLFLGNQINDCRDCSGLYFLLPCEKGYITKWDVQKPVWDYVFSHNVCPINEKPVIMTQPLFNFKSIQDCMDEIFFEEYEVPSMFRLNPTDLGRLKYIEDNNFTQDVPCIIVDTGYSFTNIIPYINGNKYLRGIRRLNVGGKLLTNHMKDIISYRQYNVMEETFVINQVKEDTCYVAKNILEELKVAAKSGSENTIVKNYVLPDFNNIRRGYIQDSSDLSRKEYEDNCQILRLNNERFIVPEILFHPSDIGMKCMGIAEAVVKSIYSCPNEYQEELCKHIILIGGNCNFPGFKERMYNELRSQLPHSWQVHVFQPKNPVSYNWEGGSSLLKVPDFKTYMVTKAEYEELGSTIIQQRFNTWMIDNSEIKEETREKEEILSYLDNLKDKSVFGKQEPGENVSKTDSDESDTNIQTSDGNMNNTGQNVSDENNQDSLCHNSETDIGSKLKKTQLKTNENATETLDEFYLEEEECEDLRNSVDLFPLGNGSYL